MSPADERFEALVSEMLADAAPKHPPTDLILDIDYALDNSRRRPRWFASLKEPPMRYSSTLAVGSSTARVAAVIAVTLLLLLSLSVAGLVGSRLLATSGPIIVDGTGAGTVTTITEAVGMAADGDTVLVRPGTYVEAVTLDKDIVLAGDGPLEEIVWMAPADGPVNHVERSWYDHFALLIEDSDAMVRDLTFRGQDSQLHVRAGAPTISGLVFEGVGQAHTQPGGRALFGNAIVVNGDSAAVIRNNSLLDGGPIALFKGASAQIIDNVLTGGPSIIAFEPADGAVFRGNAVSDTLDRGIGVFGPSRMTIEDNVVRDPRGTGISVGLIRAPGVDLVVRRNTIIGARTAINVAPAAQPTITDNLVSGSQTGLMAGLDTDGMVVARNTFVDNTTGISAGPTNAAFRDNVISGGDIGVVITGDRVPTLVGNTIEGAAQRGLAIYESAAPVLLDNRICGNASNLVIESLAASGPDGTNEICSDPPTSG